MNKREKDILLEIYSNGFYNQRLLAEACCCSLGVVNKVLKNLINSCYLDDNYSLTTKALSIIENNKPRNAIILAAGYGMRMIPINMQYPKGLLEINGEPLIERAIKQLHEVGIFDIKVVVGFMKESYEYLIDLYGVKLVVNEKYALKNNLYSLSLVSNDISNTYVVPCDIWCKYNPFRRNELYSWYMVSDKEEYASEVRVNRKNELIKIAHEIKGNQMIGIAYLSVEQAMVVCERMNSYINNSNYDNSFWEVALYNVDRMNLYAYVVNSNDFIEINTYEQLRELDKNSNQLKSDAIDIISRALGVSANDVTDISVLKKGMTNRSFLFSCNNKKYIMRIPGEGTDRLINRYQEAEVYRVLSNNSICDDVCYINPTNGYKITSFFEDARECNSSDVSDLKICMKKLKEFHDLNLVVNHEFDIFGQIDFYESLWENNHSIYKDYNITKDNIFSLRLFIEKYREKICLTHIDAVPDNFLFFKNVKGEEEVRLIDWEYSGMQDPHVDLAMFSIYALYDKAQIDQLIDIYFDGKCAYYVRIKIYCYVAACGLLWSNWCEYKRSLGVEFGEYSLRQYRYAKDYYAIVREELKKNGEI